MNDGGPAFPGGISAALKATDDTPPTQSGMSLRDYFAAAAMQGFLRANAKLKDNDNPNESDFSNAAYRVADAMLKERERKT